MNGAGVTLLSLSRLSLFLLFMWNFDWCHIWHVSPAVVLCPLSLEQPFPQAEGLSYPDTVSSLNVQQIPLDDLWRHGWLGTPLEFLSHKSGESENLYFNKVLRYCWLAGHCLRSNAVVGHGGQAGSVEFMGGMHGPHTNPSLLSLSPLVWTQWVLVSWEHLDVS